jgi:hypothetical protein
MTHATATIPPPLAGMAAGHTSLVHERVDNPRNPTIPPTYSPLSTAVDNCPQEAEE